MSLSVALGVNAQTFDFDMTKDGKGLKSGFLSVEVPDGNYRVRVIFWFEEACRRDHPALREPPTVGA